MQQNKKRARKYNLGRAVLNRENLEQIEALLKEANLVMTMNLKEGKDLKHLLSNKSFCGPLINKKQFSEAKNEDRLRERIILNIIVPEIVKRYNKELKTLGRRSAGLSNFFEDLDSTPYDMFDAELEYGVSISTLKNHKKLDKFKEKGETVVRGFMMWREPPE